MALPRARGTVGAIVETTLRALVKPGPARGEILAMDKVLVRGHPAPQLASPSPSGAGANRTGASLAGGRRRGHQGHGSHDAT